VIFLRGKTEHEREWERGVELVNHPESHNPKREISSLATEKITLPEHAQINCDYR